MTMQIENEIMKCRTFWNSYIISRERINSWINAILEHSSFLQIKLHNDGFTVYMSDMSTGCPIEEFISYLKYKNNAKVTKEEFIMLCSMIYEKLEKKKKKIDLESKDSIIENIIFEECVLDESDYEKIVCQTNF